MPSRAASRSAEVAGAGSESLEPALYVVATPIGNLEDITLRALRVLGNCDLIASEDTRTTIKLLAHFGISTPLTSYHQHSRGSKARDIARQISEGRSVALVSEAGTPAISDPGIELISECVALGVKVVPLPGACALIALLSSAGLDTRSFVFEGFPPRKPGELRRLLQSCAGEMRTMVFYESPNRARAALAAMAEVFGQDRRAAIGRELTKLHEEIWRGTLADAVVEFTDRRPRGEFVIAVEGAQPAPGEMPNLEKEYRRLVEEGLDQKTVLATLTRTSGRRRREIYESILRWKKEP